MDAFEIPIIGYIILFFALWSFVFACLMADKTVSLIDVIKYSFYVSVAVFVIMLIIIKFV